MNQYEQLKEKRTRYMDWKRQHWNDVVVRDRPERPDFIYDDASDMSYQIANLNDEWTLYFTKCFVSELDKTNVFKQWRLVDEPDQDSFIKAREDAKRRLTNGELVEVPDRDKFTKPVRVYADNWNGEERAKQLVEQLKTDIEPLELNRFVSSVQADFDQWKQENKPVYDLIQTLAQIINLSALNDGERRGLKRVWSGTDASSLIEDNVPNLIQSLASAARKTAIENYRPSIAKDALICMENALNATMREKQKAEDAGRLERAAREKHELLKRRFAEIEAQEKAEKKTNR